jgi:hypothetical protein
MLAHPTAITELTGLRAEYLSAPARGMAGDAVGVGAAGVMGAVAGATDAVLMATDAVAMATDVAGMATGGGLLPDAELTVATALRVDRLAPSTEAVGFMAVL